jgi:hypothetical protein
MLKRYIWFEKRRQEFLQIHKNDKNRAKVNTKAFIEYIKSKMKPKVWNKYKHILDQKEANLPHHRQQNYDPAISKQARNRFALKRYEFMYGPLKCKHCGSTEGPLFTKLRNKSNIRILTRHDYCSDSCSKKSKEAYNKRVATTLKRYGTTNISKCPAIKKRLSEVNKDPDFIARKNAKARETIIKKYGSLELYYATQAKKRLPTVQKKYGGNAPTCNPLIKQKVKNTLMKNYGVDNPMHSPEIIQKLKHTQCHRHVTIRIQGKQFKDLQGDEPFFLQWFCKNAEHHSINDIYESCVYLRYHWNNKLRMYYPDFIIPKSSIIIEVKSDYTCGYKKVGKGYNYDKNRAKSIATVNRGFKYLFAVCYPEKNKVFLWKGKLPSREKFTQKLTEWKQSHL